MNKSMVRKAIPWLLVILVAVLIIFPDIWKGEEKKKVSADTQKPIKNEIMVNGEIIQYSHTDRSVFATGTLLGDEEVNLRAEISGRIIKLNLEEGASVKKGELLVKLNDKDLQAQLNKAYERLKLLELTESRQRQLFEKQGISRQDYDIALSELSSQKAEIDYLKAMIDRTEIRSPFDGTVGLRYVSIGAYITPADNIAALQKLDYMKIDFSVPQKYYNNISKGSSLSFRVPPDTKRYQVSVLATEPKIDEITRTFKIRGRFNNSAYKLIPGSYAEVDIVTDINPESIMIPTIALIPNITSEYVLLYKSGKVEKCDVITGTRSPSEVEIIKGLTVGDTLISSGLMQIKPGDEVKINVKSSNGKL
jgi:membrane fusion protein (multidrug efflux system)